MDAYPAYRSIPRLSRDIVVTEKIDGTNALIAIEETPYEVGNYTVRAGSRSRWLEPVKSKDNFGFAQWVKDHEIALTTLGPGLHYGEWWGRGIQRGYGLDEKRFSLFHTGGLWHLPKCVSVVPTLYKGPFSTREITDKLTDLSIMGSYAAPGFMDPEGVVIYHEASRQLFKKTIKGDEKGKRQ